ncbi:MAG: hypothetical protein CMC08_05065 [Flavobacteriaceae bacterium]|nr:hypothetical protein [Flavobacteriaceae bacterium]
MYAFVPLLLSGLLCIALIFLLWQKLVDEPEFTVKLSELATVFISISGFLSAIIMVYLAASALTVKTNRNQVIDSLSKVTQQMHHFRSIIELLMQSKMWLPGLKEYIDEEYAGLTFFEVKEFYKGKSKLAIEFLQEHHNYADTENLYLELKALLMTDPKQKKIPETISYPKVYDKPIVEKWLEHKCGSGLWYYFGYKYGIYKEALDYEAVFERHQEKIMTLANTIDSKAFEDSSFNEVFLSKLGEYMANEVLPKLYQFQDRMDERLPAIMRYLYGIFLLLVLFGVLLPLTSLLFSWAPLLLIISFSFVVSTIFFIATTFYPFITREVNN